MWFDFDVLAGEADVIGAELAEPPLFAAATPEWYCDSGVIGAVQPRDERFAGYDSAFTHGVGNMRQTREAEPRFDKRFGRYGLRNFGDNFGSDGPNWDNLEYDLGYSCLLQFMRSTDVAALRMGREAVLHNMNVDILRIRDGYHWPCGHQGDHNVQFAGLGHRLCAKHALDSQSDLLDSEESTRQKFVTVLREPLDALKSHDFANS